MSEATQPRGFGTSTRTPRPLSTPQRPGERAPGWLTQRRFAWAAAAAIALGVVVRAVLVLSRDFPLNDGALFLLMARELGEAGFHLPAYTAYNAAHIPFAYSPLGFYLVAALHAALPVGLADLFRYLPLVVTSLTVGAFFLLARTLLTSRATVLAALCAFAVLPRSYLWLIMGGGLTRSLGFLFAILTLHQLHAVYTRRDWRYVVTTTILASLTVLSHLGTAPFVVFSAALFLVTWGRHRYGLLASAVIALGTAALTAPWWVSVLNMHGIAPFLAANATGGSVFTAEGRGFVVGKIARFGLGTAEPLFPLIGALAVFGALVSIARERYLIPAWWLTIVLLDVRAGATYSSIPVALLAGVAITDMLVPAFVAGSLRATAGARLDTARALSTRRRWIAAAVLAVLLGYGTLSALVRAPHLGAEGRFLTSLTPDDRAAMEWAAQETPPTSRFVIVVGAAAGGWWADRMSEWFPVLARRVSVATVQGTEWLPNGEFRARERRYDELQGCAIWTADCLEQWAARTGLAYTHVYIPKTLPFPCCDPLLTALRADARYQLVYDGPAALVFARHGAAGATGATGATTAE